MVSSGRIKALESLIELKVYSTVVMGHATSAGTVVEHLGTRRHC
jgi:hypothetical protein